MRATAILTLLLAAGCGGSNTPDQGNANARHRHSGGEAVCVERPPATPQVGGLDGRWFLLEPDDDDVDLVIEIEGDRGTALRDEGSESVPIVVVPRDDGLGEIRLTHPHLGEVHVLLLPRGPGSMLAMAQGEEDARIARRATPVPPSLEGHWVLVDPRGREPDIELEVRGDHASVEIGGETRTVQLFGLAPDGPTIDLVTQRLDRDRGDLQWLSLQAVDPDVLILRAGTDEEFRVMHRPGMAPAWLARWSGAATRAGPPTTGP